MIANLQSFVFQRFTIILISIGCSTSVLGQTVFSETFDEVDESTTGIDNTNGVGWSTVCPTCLDAGDFFKVLNGELVGQDSNGPATWESGSIDISNCNFFDISFLLKEEGTMEACGTGCTSVDWVQLEYNIDNTGWQTPSNSYFCSGACANINVIQGDDIPSGSMNYSTGCIASGNTLQFRITVQAWAASERWIVDDIIVSCATGPSVNAGMDQFSCGSNVTLTATNPDGANISWDNGVMDGQPFLPALGVTDYVVSADLGGCVATDTVQVTLANPPTFNISENHPTSCGGADGSISFTNLLPNTSYLVSYQDGTTQGPISLNTDANGTAILNNLVANSYSSFEVSLNGCSSIDNSTVVLSDPNAPNIDAGTDWSECTGTSITLTANNPDGANLTWDHGITDGTPFSVLSGSTIYTVTADLNGCISSDMVEVVGVTPPVIDAGTNEVICEGIPLTLTASNPNAANLTWNNGVINGDPFTPPIGTTTYQLTADLDGCVVTDQVVVTVNAIPTFTVAGQNPSTCSGTDGSVTISGLTPNQTFELTYNNNNSIVGPTTINSDQNGNFVMANLSQASYADFTINQSGCETTDLNTLQLVDPPIPNIDAGDSIFICLGDDVTLTAFNPDIGILNWNNGVSDGVPFTPNQTNMYTVTAELNNCFNTDSVYLSVLSAPIVNAGDDYFICKGDTLNLSAATPNGGTLTWNQGVINGQDFVPTFSGSYIATATIGSCTNSDTVEITISEGPNPNFVFNPNNPTVEDTEVEFIPVESNTSGLDYYWEFGDNQSSNLTSPIHFYPEIGNLTYPVQLFVTDEFGCQDSSIQYITIDDILLYYVPNAFTPDQDQINNTFQPVFTSGFDIYDYHLTIFNRWGEILFESYNAQIGWNGTYLSGEIVSSGVYVYTIQFGDLKSDERQMITGTVTVLR